MHRLNCLRVLALLDERIALLALLLRLSCVQVHLLVALLLKFLEVLDLLFNSVTSELHVRVIVSLDRLLKLFKLRIAVANSLKSADGLDAKSRLGTAQST